MHSLLYSFIQSFNHSIRSLIQSRLPSYLHLLFSYVTIYVHITFSFLRLLSSSFIVFLFSPAPHILCLFQVSYTYPSMFVHHSLYFSLPSFVHVPKHVRPSFTLFLTTMYTLRLLVMYMFDVYFVTLLMFLTTMFHVYASLFSPQNMSIKGTVV